MLFNVGNEAKEKISVFQAVACSSIHELRPSEMPFAIPSCHCVIWKSPGLLMALGSFNTINQSLDHVTPVFLGSKVSSESFRYADPLLELSALCAIDRV